MGFPKLFFTIAPYEYSFQYHEWLRDQMAKELRARMHLPVEETMHVTHSMLQIVRGFMSGTNQQTAGRNDRSWTKHVFAARDGSGHRARIVIFTRVEFQDGSRKEGTKR